MSDEGPICQSTPKKARVQVNPNASVLATLGDSSYLTSLPAVPEDPSNYTPILYTFRVTPVDKTDFKHLTARPPPFYLLLDHAIAVIWSLFNPEAKRDSLGIAQLQWGLYFLQSIRNGNGVHPRDVQLCIDNIQDWLMGEYADISEESVLYGTTPVVHKIVKNDSFSPNYTQMIDRIPAKRLLETKESTVLDQQLWTEFESIKKECGFEMEDLQRSMPRDEMFTQLSGWKDEQLEKIQCEMKMLHCLENLMKNVNEGNFDGFTDETAFHTIFNKN